MVADLKDELEALIKDNKKYRCTGPSQEEINEVRNAESRVIYQLQMLDLTQQIV